MIPEYAISVELDQHFCNTLCKHTHMHTVGPMLTPAVTDISMMIIFTSSYEYMKLNTTNGKFCKHTHTCTHTANTNDDITTYCLFG